MGTEAEGQSGEHVIQSFEEYIKGLIRDRFVSERDLAPLKCLFCESKDLEEKHFYENHYVVEIEVSCKDCGKVTGNWSYGHWEV